MISAIIARLALSVSVSCHAVPVWGVEARTVEAEAGTDVVLGPGGPGNRIATPWEHTVGLERIEYLARMSGRPLYLLDPLRIEHYGTLKEPISVDSVVGERIVGCTGYPKESHEVVWMLVNGQRGDGLCPENRQPVTRCPECGQSFQINKLSP
jgi:cytochrome c oxidase subunit 5b